MEQVYIKGVGSFVPDCVLSNADLEKMVDTSDEWIVTRTGIRSRHICLDSETTLDLCYEAAKKALLSANISACDIDLIVVATVTPDMQFPATACLLQKKLECFDIPCFDIGAACSGYIYALETARSFLLSNHAIKNVLVLGAEKLSSLVDWEDRSTCVLFGDGAGATVLSRTTDNIGILDTLIGADGRSAELLYCRGYSADKSLEAKDSKNRDFYIKMEGREVFKEAVKRMCSAIDDIFIRNHVTIEDIDWVIPHQANERIITAIAERAHIPAHKMFINVSEKGNTSAASIPIAIDEAVDSGLITSKSLGLIVSFGAGMTWGASLIRWK